MDKYFKMSYLIDIYSSLLTNKQQQVLNLHYSDDLSLSEIATILEISRQAVYDLLNRGEKIILKYDDKLKLLDKYEKNLYLLNELAKKTRDESSLEIINSIKENL